MADETIYAWCVDCGTKFTEAQVADAYACPACGSEGHPCSPSDDVAVNINWHELRILVIWAENYAAAHAEQSPSMPRTVRAIAKRLQEQFPSQRPLTLAGEFAQLAEKYDIEVTGPIQPDPDALPPRRN